MANVFPETSDSITQANWQSLIRSIYGGADMRVKGMGLTPGSGLSVDVGTGYAVIDNKLVEYTTSQNKASLTASTTNYIFMDSAGTLTSSTTPDAGTGKISLGKALTDGTTCTDTKGVADGAPVVEADGIYFAQLDTGVATSNGESTKVSVNDFTLPTLNRGETWYFVHGFRWARANTSAQPCSVFESNGQYCVYAHITGIDNDGGQLGVYRMRSWGGAAGYDMTYFEPALTGVGDTSNLPVMGWNVVGLDAASGGGTVTPVVKIWDWSTGGDEVTLKGDSFIVGWRIN